MILYLVHKQTFLDMTYILLYWSTKNVILHPISDMEFLSGKPLMFTVVNSMFKTRFQKTYD